MPTQYSIVIFKYSIIQAQSLTLTFQKKKKIFLHKNPCLQPQLPILGHLLEALYQSLLILRSHVQVDILWFTISCLFEYCRYTFCHTLEQALRKRHNMISQQQLDLNQPEEINIQKSIIQSHLINNMTTIKKKNLNDYS